ncbi:Hsp70 family protein [Streptomyces sp. NPDC058611]|uniref:Hsp70 family protein n=1 Tax=unclassified Streptomyces TaxID=2593676 RepID=UPI00365F8575
MSGSPSAGAFVPKVVVAIDFGTHGSGFAWAPVSSLQDAAHNRTIVYADFVTGEGGTAYPKDLTAVLVDRKGEAVEFGLKARKRWYAELARNKDNPSGFGYATRFKMALRKGGHEDEMPRFHGSLATAVGQAERHEIAEKLTAAYLRRLYETALSEIAATGGFGIGYTGDDIRWCITVPAMWREAEKQVMRRAAEEAGIPSGEDRLVLVSEPEAAAVHCTLTRGTLLGTERPEGRLHVDQDGSRFLVVDCGGGTVDVTSYQIRPAGLGVDRLAEIAIANGGPFGSAYINQHFVDRILTDRFGRDRIKALKASHPREIAVLEDCWEKEKVGLHSELAPDGTPVFTTGCDIDVPGRLWEALDEDTRELLTALAADDPYHLVLSPEEATDLHEAVVGEILQVIEEQCHQLADGGPGEDVGQIVLVGGFARSTYLRDRIAQRFGSRMRVVLPQDPAVAVLGGAVHFAYDPSVIWGRLSKYTYGFACSEPFREGTDPEAYRYTDDDGDERCNHRFKVMVQRGELVPVDKFVESTMRVVTREAKSFDIDLLATFDDAPAYTTDEGCELLGEVHADISGSVGKPSAERIVDIAFRFGGTEITVETCDRITGVRHRAAITFTELYGRRGQAGE